MKNLTPRAGFVLHYGKCSVRHTRTNPMPFIIDGHNLIGQMPDISLRDPDDEAKLVVKLTGFCARERRICVVIFDKGVPGGVSHLTNSVVKVLFASPGFTADQIILARIDAIRDKPNWTIVSSDNYVLNAAKQNGMRYIRSHEFAHRLRTPKKQKTDWRDKEDMDIYVPPEEVEEWLRVFGAWAELTEKTPQEEEHALFLRAVGAPPTPEIPLNDNDMFLHVMKLMDKKSKSD